MLGIANVYAQNATPRGPLGKNFIQRATMHSPVLVGDYTPTSAFRKNYMYRGTADSLSVANLSSYSLPKGPMGKHLLRRIKTESHADVTQVTGSPAGPMGKR